MRNMDAFLGAIACATLGGKCVSFALGLDDVGSLGTGYLWIWWIPAYGWVLSAYRLAQASLKA